MSKTDRHDIDDNEIRVISKIESGDKPRGGNRRLGILAAAMLCLAAIAAVVYLMTGGTEMEELPVETSEPSELALPEITPVTETTAAAAKPYCEITDTVAGGHRFLLLTPRQATPSLGLGAKALNDTSAVLVVQAADIRRDNGNIVGAYVLQGKLLSKGQAKSGFCAIINGKMTIGVADSTPLLEQALETDGYFFRQYPLVVGGQVVENKPKGKSLRKALAEIGGAPTVVLSRDKMAFGDFSQALAELGATNAIYLVGSASYGFATDQEGRKIDFGIPGETSSLPENTNYLIWR